MDINLITNEILGANITDVKVFDDKAKLIINALNAKQDAINLYNKTKYSVGNKVSFTNSNKNYDGTITKINKKKAVVDVDMSYYNIPNQLWNVPYTQLTLIAPTK